MAKRLTIGEKIRRYMEEHPLAKPKQKAEALGVSVKYVHVLRSSDKKKAAQGMPINRIPRIKRKTNSEKWSKVLTTTTSKPLPIPKNTLSITMVEPKADPVNHPPHYKIGRAHV